MPTKLALTNDDLNRAVAAGLRAANLIEMAKVDLITQPDLRRFLEAALKSLK